MAKPTALSPAAQEAALVTGARQLGLDPAAVLAVTNVEQPGLQGHVGDSGTSFGPFQLHAGGALPPSVFAQGADYANAWANSPEGISYGLRQESTVAHGLSGAAAIHAIVYRFERPTDKAGEESTAMASYADSQKRADAVGNGGGGYNYGIESVVGGAIRHIPGVAQIEGIKGPSGLDVIHGVSGAVSGTAKDVSSAASSTADFLGKLTNATLWERALYVIGGSVLVFAGLGIVAREIGARSPVPVGVASKLAKVGI